VLIIRDLDHEQLTFYYFGGTEWQIVV